MRAATVIVLLLFTGCSLMYDPDEVPRPAEKQAATKVLRFAYVASQDGTVSTYAADAATGRLRANGYVIAASSSSVWGAATSIAVDPLGRFAFVSLEEGTAGGEVLTYRIDGATGRLANAGRVSVGQGPRSVAVDPSGRFVYVVSAGGPDPVVSGSVSAWAIDANTGALNGVGAPFFGEDPRSFAVDPSGKFAYVPSCLMGGVFVFAIDTMTGALASVGTPDGSLGCPVSVAVDPTGRFAYVLNGGSANDPANVAAYAINPDKGSLIPIGAPAATGSSPTSIAVDPSGSFAYVANGAGFSAYAIDADTGAISSIGLVQPTGAGPTSVAIEPSGRFAYVTNIGSSDLSTYSLEAGTGMPRPVRTIAARSSPMSIALTQGDEPVTYAPAFAYVTNWSSNDVSAYAVDAGAGGLTSIGPATATGAEPSSVAVDPVGRYAFVTSYGSTGSGSGSVFAYTIDASTGALPPSYSPPIASGSGPNAIVVDPSGRFAYVTCQSSNDVWAYSIDGSAAGPIAPLSPPVTAGGAPRAIAFDPTGQFAYVANYSSGDVSSFAIDVRTGALVSLGPAVPAGSGATSIVVEPSGRWVYVANAAADAISAYAIKSGGVLVPNPLPLVATGLTAPVSIAVDPWGRFAYVVNQGSASVSAYSIDPATGALTSAGSRPTGSQPGWATVDPSGAFVYVSNSGSNTVSAYSVDPDTGALKEIATVATERGPGPIALTASMK